MPTTTALLEWKLDRRFQVWDRDGDGYVEEADFHRLADETADAYRVPRKSPQRDRLRAMFQRIWRDQVAGFELVGGRVDARAFRDGIIASMIERPEAFETMYVPIIEQVFALADRDGDGTIDRDEYQTWFVTVFRVPEEDTAEVFRRMDANGDGRIGYDEFVETIRQFYFSDDPEAAGQWLFGAPPIAVRVLPGRMKGAGPEGPAPLR